MTVSSTDSRWDYIQVGTFDSYDYACEIYIKTDLKVYVSGVLKTVDIHYEITGTPPLYGINNPDGGIVKFKPDYIPANGAPIAIILDLPLTQLTDYKEGDKFPAETHERALDRLIKIAQAFNNVLGRILKVPLWSPLSNILVEIKAGGYLRWNATRTSIICDSGTTIGLHGESHEKDGADEISVTDLSGLLADPQTALAHKTSHQYDGGDPIKLDDLATPDDNTDLDATATKHGLFPKLIDNTDLDASTTKHGLMPKWPVSILALANALPWTIDIDVFMTAKSNVNFNTNTVNVSCLNNGWRNSSNAQNDSIAWDVILAAGTWTFELLHFTGPNRGIYSVQFDSVEKGTIDGYSAGDAYNVRSSVTDIVVSITAKIELKLKMATKNGASDGYFGYINGIRLRKTA